jgi:hypothetical protein
MVARALAYIAWYALGVILICGGLVVIFYGGAPLARDNPPIGDALLGAIEALVGFVMLVAGYRSGARANAIRKRTSPTSPNNASSPANTTALVSDGVKKVLSGQRLMQYAILAYIASVAVQMYVSPLAGSLGVVLTTIIGVVGFVKVSRGLRDSAFMTIVLVVLMLVPIVNLITLLIVNSRATRALRSAGYRVGFLGASK